MPVTKGDPRWSKYGKQGGRRGYDYEQKELDRMKKILQKYFLLLEKPSLTNPEKERFFRLEKAALKIMDKRHANKTDMKIEMDRPLLIIKE